MRANECGAVHHLRDIFKASRDLDVVDDRIDGGESAFHFRNRHAHFERDIALRIKRIGRRHAAAHPQQNARIGPRARMFEIFAVGGLQQSRFASE